jgi:hypothetical protein
MPMMQVKVVPDAQPNADGVWELHDVPKTKGRGTFDFVPRPGFHIVAMRKPDDPQDGGPMHARFLDGR